MNTTASDDPIQTPTEPEAAPVSKCCATLVEYVEHNPLAAVVQALALGFAVGMIIRLIEGSAARDPEIDVKRKPTIDDAKYHLGSLLLPFLWPAWQKAQEGYGKSSKSVKDVVGQVKKGKLTAEGKERLKDVEDWAGREAEVLADLGKKGAKTLEAWVGKEGERLTGLGKKKAKDVEDWLEKEILPAAECGWKKLRKLFR